MNYKFKKALAIFLTLIMVMNIFPISVYAENENAGGVDPLNYPTRINVVVERTVFDLPEQQYYIIALNSAGQAVAYHDLSSEQEHAQFYALSNHNVTYNSLNSLYTFKIIKKETNTYLPNAYTTSLSTLVYEIIESSGKLGNYYFSWNNKPDDNGNVNISISDESVENRTITLTNDQVIVEKKAAEDFLDIIGAAPTRNRMNSRKTGSDTGADDKDSKSNNGDNSQSIEGFAAFDISPIDNIQQTKGGYDVTVSLKDKEKIDMLENASIPEGATVTYAYTLYHILKDKDGNNTSEYETIIPQVEENDGIISGFSFCTDTFSDFVLKYTVIFHNDNEDVTITGGSQILLSALINQLKLTCADGTAFTVDEVEAVEFNNPELFTAREVSSGTEITLNANTDDEETVTIQSEHDFVLTSEQPFDADQMIIFLKSGERVSVNVTDDQTLFTVQMSTAPEFTNEYYYIWIKTTNLDPDDPGFVPGNNIYYKFIPIVSGETEYPITNDDWKNASYYPPYEPSDTDEFEIHIIKNIGGANTQINSNGNEELINNGKAVESDSIGTYEIQDIGDVADGLCLVTLRAPDKLDISINFHDYDGTNIPAAPPQNMSGQFYLIAAYTNMALEDLDSWPGNTPWEIVNLSALSNANTPYPISIENFKNVPNPMESDPGISYGNIISADNFDPDNIKIRLVYTDKTLSTLQDLKDLSSTAYLKIINGGIEGYDFMDRVYQGYTDSTDPLSTYRVNVIKGSTSTLDVVFEFESSEHTKTVAEGDYYVILDATSSDGNTHYYKTVAVSTDEDEVRTVVNVAEGWTDGQVYSPNWQSITATLIKAKTTGSITAGPGKPNENAYSEVSMIGDHECVYSCVEENDPENHIKHIEHKFTLIYSPLEDALTLSQLLGPGQNYGITAQTFNQVGHMETNIATNYYKCEGDNSVNLQPGLSNAAGSIVAGHIEGMMHLNVPGDRTAVLFIDKDDVDKVDGTKSRAVAVLTTAETIAETIVDPILNHGETVSNELFEHEATLTPETDFVDLTQFEDGKTIYIDATNITGYLQNNKGFKLKMYPNQVVVFNIPGEDVTLSKVDVTYTDGLNQDGIAGRIRMADHLVFNMPNATSVTLAETYGLHLIPQEDSDTLISTASEGWLITGGEITSSTLGEEWHNRSQGVTDSKDADTQFSKTVDENSPRQSEVFEFELYKWDENTDDDDDDSHWSLVDTITNQGPSMVYSVPYETGRVFKIKEKGKADTTGGKYITDENVYYITIVYLGYKNDVKGAYPEYYDNAQYAIAKFRANDISGESEHGFMAELNATDDENAIRGIEFKNTRVKAGLNIQKKVSGTEDRNVDFNFDIQVWNAEIDTETNTYAYDGEIVVKKGTEVVTGYTITDGEISEEGTQKDTKKICGVNIKGDEVVSIELPVGVHYAITEVKNNAGQYPTGYSLSLINGEQAPEDGTITGVLSEEENGAVLVTFTNTYSDTGVEQGLTIAKAVTGEANVPDPIPNAFTFSATIVRTDPTTLQATAPTYKSVTNNAGTVTFAPVAFSAVGDYVYAITETAVDPDLGAGFSLNNTPIYAKVHVTKSGATYGATVDYYSDADCDDSHKLSVANTKITNTYTERAVEQGLTIAKAVTGEANVPDPIPNAFTFSATIVRTDPTTLQATAPTYQSVTNNAGTVTFAPVAFSAVGDYVYAITETAVDPDLGAGFSLNNTPIYAKVHVTKSGATYGATVDYYSDADCDDSHKLSVANTKITNTYTERAVEQGLTIAKAVTGEANVPDPIPNAFTFSATIVRTDPTTLQATAPTYQSVTNNAGTVTFAPVAFSAVGDYVYAITETAVDPDLGAGFSLNNTPIYAKVHVTKSGATYGAKVDYYSDADCDDSHKLSVANTKITNTYTERAVEQGLTIAKAVTGEANVPDPIPNAFTFSATIVRTDPTTLQATAPTYQSVTNNAGTVTFAPVAFSAVGDYVYAITETAVDPDLGAGFSLNNTPIYAKVHVTKSGATYGATVDYYSDADCDDSHKLSVANTKITNTYTERAVEQGLTIAKAVTGEANVPDPIPNAFTFSATIVRTDPTTLQATAPTYQSVTNNAGTVTFAPVAFSAVGDYVYAITETAVDPDLGAGFSLNNTPIYAKVHVTKSGATYGATVDYYSDADCDDSHKLSVANTKITNTYTERAVEQGLTIAKAVTGEANVPDPIPNAFTFSATIVRTDPTTLQATAPTYQSVTNNAGTVTFAPVAFSAVGDYVYAITETAVDPDLGAGFSLNNTPIYAKVHVTKSGATYGAKVDYYSDADCDDSHKLSVANTKITNTYTERAVEQGLTIAKAVTGEANVPDPIPNAFTFSATIVRTDPTTLQATAPTYQSVTNNAGTVTFAPVAFSAVGDYVYAITETAVDPDLGAGFSLNNTPIYAKVHVTKSGATYGATVDYYSDADCDDSHKLSVANTKITNTYTERAVEQGLTIAKAVTGEANVPDPIPNAFTFSATIVRTDPTTLQATAPTYQSVTNNAGTVTFAPVAFSAVGDYVYAITETAVDPDLGAGFSLNNTPIYAKVHVTKSGATYGATVDYYSDADCDDSHKLSVANTKITNTYTETYTTHGLEIKKDVTGTNAPTTLVDGTFKFQVTNVSKPDGVTTAPAYEEASNVGNTVSFAAVTFSADGTYIYEISEKEIDSTKMPGFATVSADKIYAKIVIAKTGATYSVESVSYYSNQACTAVVENDNIKITNEYEIRDKISHDTVDIYKEDKNTKDPLDGAEFTLYNSDTCKDADQIKTYTGKKFSIDTEDPDLATYLPADETTTSKLYLKETKAPEGYVLDDTVHAITITMAISGPEYDADEDAFVTTTTYSIEIDNEEKINIPNEKTEVPQVSATVKKIWNDDNNRDGKRPEDLTIQLLADGEKTGKSVTLTNKNGWIGRISELPKCNTEGKEIKYTWAEPETEGYKLSSNTTNGTLTTLTNTYTPETTQISVKKVWVDEGKHPNEVKVQLFANKQALGEAVTLNEGNGWKYSWNDLCKYDAGEIIQYTVTETEIPEGYAVKVTGSASTGYVITNTLQQGTLLIRKQFNIQQPEIPPEEEELKTDIQVVKIWDDNDNKDGNRPEKITVRLYAGGQEIKTAELSEKNGWRRTFGDLPKFVDGHPIHYSVKEDPVKWYVPEIRGFTITNRYQPQRTSVAIQKVWDDAGNEKFRPKSVHMKLSNGMSIELNAKNGWSGVITDLPKYVNGKEAVYTWSEPEVLGYQIKSVVSEDNLTVITNEPFRNDGTPKGKKPASSGPKTEQFDDYKTPLGVSEMINHVGDCFD